MRATVRDLPLASASRATATGVDEGLVELPIEIITISNNDNRRVLHLRLLHELGHEAQHRDTLARTLGVPHDAAFARARLHPLSVGGARIHNQVRFRLRPGGCNHRYPDRFPDRVELVICGDFFYDASVGVFEQNKVS